MDNAISGTTGAHATAQFWEYDTRAVKRWNLDPKPNLPLVDDAAKTGVDIVGTNFNKVLPTQDYINPLKVAEYKTLIQNGVKVPASEAYQ